MAVNSWSEYYSTYITQEWDGCTVASGQSKVNSIVNYPNTQNTGSNPFWRSQVAAGVNATTNYSRSGYMVPRHIPGTISVSGKCSVPTLPDHFRGYSGFGYTLPASISMTQPTDEADNQALSSFNKSCRRATTQISGGVFLGELSETLRMIKHPAMALRKLVDDHLKDLARRKRRGFKHTLHANNYLAGAWLEASYGWLPLISDTKDAAIALSRFIHDKNRVTSVSGTGSTTSSSVNFTNAGYVGVNTSTQWQLQKEASVRIVGAMKAKALGPTLDHAMNVFGFHPRDFVPTVWNLIPYSFLADYFLNVGSVLEATFFDYSSLAWVSKTTKIRSTQFISCRAFPVSGWSGGAGYLGQSTVVRQSMNRAIPVTFTPTLETHLPGRPQQWINMAALALQHSKLLPFWK